MNLGFAYGRQSDGRLRVRRPRGQRLNLQFTLRRHSGLTPGITVWGAIQFGSRSPLVFIQGSLNAEPVLLPCMYSIFQQDNARLHIARVTQSIKFKTI
jgi:hypothetical protein